MVTGVTQEEALEAIRQVACERGCPLYRVGPADGYAYYTSDARGLSVWLPERPLIGLQPALRGSFQQANAAVAAATLNLLRSRGLGSPRRPCGAAWSGPTCRAASRF